MGWEDELAANRFGCSKRGLLLNLVDIDDRR
jgi:hypothetical protein